MPHRPFVPWTEIAPTQSSTFSTRSMKNTDSTTTMPATMPMMHADIEVTNAHGAVIATKPANMPLQSMLGSGFIFRGPTIHR